MTNHRHPAPGRLAVVVTIVLALTACAAPEQSTPAGASSSGDASPSATAESTPTAVPTPSATPTPPPPMSSDATFNLLPANGPPNHRPSISCSGEIGPTDPVAIVELRGTRREAGQIVMRDYSDPANPRTVCEFGDEWVQQLIDARHVVVENCDRYPCAYAVVDLPEVRYHWFALPRRDDFGSTFIAVSPGLDAITWSSIEGGDYAGGDYEDQDRRLHVTMEDGDHVVARLRPVGGRCGSGDDSKQGAYSRSGKHQYALDVPIASDTVFVGLEGLDRAFLFRPPRGGWPTDEQPAQPVWSPTSETLYYRRAGSVWKWTPAGGEKLFIPDVFWQFPTISPDGRYLAYAVLRDDGVNHDVYLIDLERGGEPQRIGENRNLPTFLTTTQLWLKTETGMGCVSAEMPQKMIYDINEGSESRSIIDSVRFVWPATSSIS
jgi:WD40-like Beta Propeller Repeat